MKEVKMVGTCKVCGKRHVRPAPANVAVCEPNHMHGKPVIVALRQPQAEMVGVCKVCGEIHIRPAPADTAVCSYCNPEPILVPLKPMSKALRDFAHPTFRFELTKERSPKISKTRVCIYE